MSKLAKALTAAAGNAGGDNLYVEDVFSTYLYEGNGAYQTITNGIDLLNEGGLVWGKSRTTSDRDNYLWDTERGYTSGDTNFSGHTLSSNTTTAEQSGEHVRNIYEDGYQSWGGYHINMTGQDYVSWTFRKAEKFFDVVTYTGDGVDNRQIPHNLGSAPGMIIVKSTSSGGQWPVYHQSLGTGAVRLNLTNAYNSADIWWKTTPTDSHFTVYGGNEVNVSGIEYVAYLFASDAGGFGDDGDESIIKCGSWNENSTNNVAVDCGFEPAFVMFKCADAASSWYMVDSMRGIPTPSSGTTTGNYISTALQANASTAESSANAISLTSTGFTWYADGRLTNTAKWIYIAIRRPMKTPESGTEVFAVDDRAAATPAFVSDFPVDLYWTRAKTGGNFFDYARLRGDNYLQHDGTNAETSGAAYFDSNTGVGSSGSASTDNLAWMFKRATGFMDVVCYTGTGSARTIAHNLGVAPSMTVIKRRNGSGYSWPTWHSGYSLYSTPTYNTYMNLNTDGAVAADATLWNSTLPTESVFSVGSSSETNQNNGTYVAYLFGEVAGVSKFGSYTGTGSTIDIDCGFSAGARFILIKRLTPGSGDWFVFDTFRGIVAGNDPYLYLNTGTAENTGDYIDPLASGFTITSSATWINISTYKYIFWAIA